jgi:hypothetical protein
MKAWRKEIKALQKNRTGANLKEMKAEIRANNEKLEVLQDTSLPDGYPRSQQMDAHQDGM